MSTRSGEWRRSTVSRKRLARESLNATLIALGVFSAAMGLKGFLLSSGFIDGGVTGISMLLAKTTGAPLSVLLPAINLPFVVVGYRLLGRGFAIRSVLGIAGLAGALATVPFPDVTPDLTLTAVFGGFFLGAGIGLAVRGGAVLDGTEIAALVIRPPSSSFIRSPARRAARSGSGDFTRGMRHKGDE